MLHCPVNGKLVTVQYSYIVHSYTYPVIISQYTVKKVRDFPVPSQDVINQTLPGRERDGDGKIANLFLQCKEVMLPNLIKERHCIFLPLYLLQKANGVVKIILSFVIS